MSRELASPDRGHGAACGSSPGQARRAWLLTQWMAGVFAVLVAAGMLLGYVNARTDDPLKSARLADLKEKLRANPADEQIKQNIRLLDLELRQHYFRYLMANELGRLDVAGRGGPVRDGRRPGRPLSETASTAQSPTRRPASQAVRAAALARWSVAACGAALAEGSSWRASARKRPCRSGRRSSTSRSAAQLPRGGRHRPRCATSGGGRRRPAR